MTYRPSTLTLCSSAKWLPTSWKMQFVTARKPRRSRFTPASPRNMALRYASPTTARASVRIDATRSSNSSPGETMTQELGLDLPSPRPLSKPMDNRSGWTAAPKAERSSASICQSPRHYPRSRTLPHILIIDDAPDLLSVCRVGLEALDHQVHTAETGNEGLTEAAIRPPDVIVLDLGLPDLDGLEVCKRIRTWSQVPIIVLSADGSEDRKVDALDEGADDYMTKPFAMRELNARLRVALRHGPGDNNDHPAEIVVGPLRLHLVHYEAPLDDHPLDLAPKEFEFLAYLAHHVGKVCTRRMILENVWGPGYIKELHYLKVYAYRIRRKLNDEKGQLLQSDPSVGYRLAPPGD